MAEQDISSFKKHLMVWTMLCTTAGLLFWIFKKIMSKREEYLKQEEAAKQKRHANLAIMEEQEKIKTNDEKPSNKTDMQNDTIQYTQYQEFLPDNLWKKFSLTSESREIQKYDLSFESNPAQVEVLIYYQSFVKLFRIVILTVKNLEKFITNDSNKIRVKVILRRSNETKYSESSQLYPIAETVPIKENFSVQMDTLDFYGCVLYITVWSIDVFYRELLLGAISIDLNSYNHNLKKNFYGDVLPVKKDTKVYGHLLVSLCHIPSTERLTCVVISGKNFTGDANSASILNKAINPYLDISLLNDGKLIKNHTTSVSKETRDPVFNEMIEFYVPQSQVTLSDILIMVFYKDDKNFNETIGKILIGSHAQEDGYKHWNKTLENPEQSFARWHAIKK
ncbi:synaptotagmin-2 [Hydra vulgaris]|uniref:synaptotagmin-2 n=1 Tax=Hydra vulgaris TaxID=6087 RepID=UPI0002B46321|nr:synaptotagmin-2 [Hydra vulgaris]